MILEFIIVYFCFFLDTTMYMLVILINVFNIFVNIKHKLPILLVIINSRVFNIRIRYTYCLYIDIKNVIY